MAQPYKLPGWAALPKGAPPSVRVLRHGEDEELLPLADKALLFGRKVPDDPKRGTKRLDHDSVSREHAVIVHSFDGKTLLCDLGSRWGTTLDGAKVAPHKYTELAEGATIKFGESTRAYVFTRRAAPREREPAASSAAGPSSAAAPPPPPPKRAGGGGRRGRDELADPMANYVDEGSTPSSRETRRARRRRREICARRSGGAR